MNSYAIDFFKIPLTETYKSVLTRKSPIIDLVTHYATYLFTFYCRHFIASFKTLHSSNSSNNINVKPSLFIYIIIIIFPRKNNFTVDV